MTVQKGDTIRFTGFRAGCGSDRGPELGATAIVAEVLSGSVVLVNWDTGVKALKGGPAGRLLFGGEYAVTLKVAPVDEELIPNPIPVVPLTTPCRSVTLWSQQVGRATRSGKGETPRAPWWHRLMDPYTRHGGILWGMIGATGWMLFIELVRAVF